MLPLGVSGEHNSSSLGLSNIVGGPPFRISSGNVCINYNSSAAIQRCKRLCFASYPSASQIWGTRPLNLRSENRGFGLAVGVSGTHPAPPISSSTQREEWRLRHTLRSRAPTGRSPRYLAPRHSHQKDATKSRVANACMVGSTVCLSCCGCRDPRC
jgi:hypothetical protein